MLGSLSLVFCDTSYLLRMQLCLDLDEALLMVRSEKEDLTDLIDLADRDRIKENLL